MIEGNLIRVPVPELSEERRKEIVKIASKYSEDCKIAIRNIRREGMDKIKLDEKNKEISKDESYQRSEDLQTLTDNYVDKIESLFTDKEKRYFKSLMVFDKKLSKHLPKHVAFIMDGNRRWAKNKIFK